jgi:predicted phosphoribosyltransferase
MFKNREEAGRLLYKELLEYKDKKDAIIVTIPRGGLPIGYTLAKQLNLPLEITLSKKIGHPYNKEYAIGAVTLEDKILSRAASQVSEDYIDEETIKIRQLLKERFKQYYGTDKPISLKGKTVIIVDDGVATGNTLISSIQLIEKQQPAKIVVALPVASKSALKRIRDLILVENTICLDAPENFRAVGQFYNEFNQVNDKEVIELLRKANKSYHLEHNRT